MKKSKQAFRIFSICCLMVVVVLTLAGCGENSDERSSGQEKAPASAGIPADDLEQNSTVQEYISVDVVSAESVGDSMYYVTYKTDTGDLEAGILHEDGTISVEEISDYDVPYCKDNASVNKFKIMSKSGSVLYENTNESCHCVAQGDGVFMILKQDRGFDTNRDYIGFMNSDGSWIMEPNKIDITKVGRQGLQNFVYMGDGMFGVNYTDNQGNFDGYYIINSKTGDAFDAGHISPSGSFIHGLLLARTSDHRRYGNILTISSSGDINDFGFGKSIMKVSEDSFLAAEGDGFICYDKQGNEKFRFMDHDVQSCGVFEDGIAFVGLMGADGKLYFSAIDERNGNLLFEPKQGFARCSYENVVFATEKEAWIFVDAQSGQELSIVDPSPTGYITGDTKLIFNGIICVDSGDGSGYRFFNMSGDEMIPHI